MAEIDVQSELQAVTQKMEVLVDELNKVNAHREQIVSQVQKGLKSQFYSRGRYSVVHERGVHYFHQLLSKYIK